MVFTYTTEWITEMISDHGWLSFTIAGFIRV